MRIVILLVILLRPPNDLLQAYITTSVPVRVLKGAHGCILASIFDVEIIPTNLKVFGVFTNAGDNRETTFHFLRLSMNIQRLGAVASVPPMRTTKPANFCIPEGSSVSRREL